MTTVPIDEHNLKPAERSDNDDRKRCLHSFEQVSSASTSDLGRIFSLSPLPTIVLDAKLRVVQVSNSHLVISGYSRAEVVGQSIYDLPAHKVPATDTVSLHRVVTHAINTGEVRIIDDVEIDDGVGHTAYRVYIMPVQDQGKLIYVVLTAYNVTEETLGSGKSHI
ncbi:hypothetical protein UA08_04995 [Talaromyces atroroseus]|uniref:PAS domain-containing protein n=1 Tax=Talaromyces atroroseus TaxID=1441469 RepID=A0A225B138_TALAT|nr:hypothetical protein UA08_04995 [Talaromyces atroroseus]OKL59517.1 hypothetical protein UA08_04995 [Talaromyces atroroseus]